MPRPTTITEEQLARWTARWELFKQIKPEIAKLSEVFAQSQGMDAMEVYFCSLWFSDELTALGATKEEIAAAGFVHGQKLYYARNDPWPTVMETVDEFRRGERLEPGLKLSLALQAKYGNPPS